MRQDGFLDQAIWIPYLTYFLLRIVYNRDYRWRNWLALAGFTGISWQSYMFAGTWIFLLFMLLGMVAFGRGPLVAVLRSEGFKPKLAVALFIVLAMALPSLSLLPLQDEFVYLASHD